MRGVYEAVWDERNEEDQKYWEDQARKEEIFAHKGCGGGMKGGYCKTCGQVLYSADVEVKNADD